jgi:tRNA (guanine-N7-)-methyltransferase
LEFLDSLAIDFLLSVPAGEGSLAHRRHVHYRVIELDSLVDRLDLEKIFERKAPLHVDLGCGDGSFLCAMAQRMPDKNFLGIERLLNRVRISARKAATLDNVRLLRVESSYAVRYLLPAESVEEFCLLFPDPWPKRRHQRRRVFSHDFLDSVAVALKAGGFLHVATDQFEYFQQIERLGRAHPRFEIVRRDDFIFPSTKFERKFREQRAPIYRRSLRKVPE